MQEPISQTKLINLRTAIEHGGGIPAVTKAYQYLDDHGYGYAGWANGVAKNDTVSGQKAVQFLQETALVGLGLEACRDITPRQMDQIRIDMAVQTLKKYEEIARDTQGILTRDLRFDETRDIHVKVFKKKSTGYQQLDA